jgi:hypothetical protein
METECSRAAFDFQPLGSRQITARFDGGTITSDAGGLLLREVEAGSGLLARLATCFDDHRDPEKIEHSVEALVKQRVFALALGYEDLNDHDQLRADPLLAVLVGKDDPTGQKRVDPRDRGKPLAGKSTLNRLELTPVGADAGHRYKKIVARHRDLEGWFVEAFLTLTPEPPSEIVLDLDATDDPLHGHQAGRFFHGYYKNYCYLPLYIFCGEHLLCAKLRPSDIDASAGSVKQVARIVRQIRARWPNVRIILRGDSGFCRENLMRWCEDHDIDFVFGLAKNKRLTRILGKELHEAQLAFAATGQPARVFKDFTYCTRKSWWRERRVVGKAEHLAKGANPRFVVTSLPAEREPAQPLYEKRYCGRGEMENRIKEQQLYLFADRTSCRTMRANQLRLWLSSAAYVLLAALRQHGLKNTSLKHARSDTIRLKLLKIGAVVRVTVRRVWFALAESCPYRDLFGQVFSNLRHWLLHTGPAARRAQLAPA